MSRHGESVPGEHVAAGSVRAREPGPIGDGGPDDGAAGIDVHDAAPAPAISLVANAEGEAPLIAPNTWIEIKGSNLAAPGDARIWQGSDFSAAAKMPTQLDGVSVTVNGKSGYVYYISPTQVNMLTPPDAIIGLGAGAAQLRRAVERCVHGAGAGVWRRRSSSSAADRTSPRRTPTEA